MWTVVKLFSDYRGGLIRRYWTGEAFEASKLLALEYSSFQAASRVAFTLGAHTLESA